MKDISKIKQGFQLLYAYFCADKIIGAYINIKAKNHRVNIFDYHSELVGSSCDRYNLGDYLGFVVANWMLEKKGLSLDTWIEKRRHMKCIGSNLYGGFQNSTVWGSGIPSKPFGGYRRIASLLLHYPLTRFDIRAVRGPLTRDILLKWGEKCPEVYGDPAILMPFIYHPKVQVNHDMIVIPQFVTEKEFREMHADLYMMSMNTTNYKAVIDAIASSKKVVTSSLHAIILAEAYGVPAVFFRGLGKHTDFKYLDYYYSTGRKDVKIANSFEEALDMEPLPLPNLQKLQEGLINTFPYDLWQSK